MYYRIAMQVEDVPAWKWKSSALCSFNLLVQWLRYYRIFPVDRLRIFTAASAHALKTPLVPAEDQDLWNTSVPAPQFLRERGLASSGQITTAAAPETLRRTFAASGASVVGTPLTVQIMGSVPAPTPYRMSLPALEQRRDALEQGSGGDHDNPYHFSVQLCLPQLHAWVQLWERVQHGDLQAEVEQSRPNLPQSLE